MGGSAFKQAAALGHPTLNTPRMSPTEYARLKDLYLTKIRGYFSSSDVKVDVLKEAPEKASYGDVDLFVGLDEQVDFVDLADAVGATGLIVHSAGNVQKCSLGVLRDGTPSQQPAIQYHNFHSNGNDCDTHTPAEITPEEYAQIDIDVIPLHIVEWNVFYSAYGDLNGLLGHVVTNLGFTVTDQGLFLRMKELDAAKTIERANVADEQGKVFLSRNPAQVMKFLGLSVEEWDAGFTTLDELYGWLGACRMLHPVAIKLRRDKAHERNREVKRDVYRRFFFEWLPVRMPDIKTAYDKEEQKPKIAALRQQYLDEALELFDKRATYEKMHSPVVLNANNTTAANLLRPLIAKHSDAKAKKLGELVRAFRRFIEFDESLGPHVAEVARSDADSELHKFLDEENTGLRDEADVDEFVRLHWSTLKERERQRAKKRLAEGVVEQEE